MTLKKIGAKERLDVWQSGWQENLDAYSRDNSDKTHLILNSSVKETQLDGKKTMYFLPVNYLR